MKTARVLLGPDRPSVLVAARPAAAEYGLKYTSLRDLVFRGELPVVRIGRAWYFKRSDIERWIDSHTEVFR